MKFIRKKKPPPPSFCFPLKFFDKQRNKQLKPNANNRNEQRNNTIFTYETLIKNRRNPIHKTAFRTSKKSKSNQSGS